MIQTEADWLTTADPLAMLDFLRGPESIKRYLFDQPIRGYSDKQISDRKARLIGCAMCRRFWRLLDEQHCRRLIEYARLYGSITERGLTEPSPDCCHQAIELAERSADEPVPAEALNALSEAASTLRHPVSDYCASYGEEVGPFDAEFVAAGHAAQAVSYAVSKTYNVVFDEPGEAFDSLHLVIDYATKAAADHEVMGWSPSEESAARERAAQAELMREIVGNPFLPAAVEPAWLLHNDSQVLEIAQTIYRDRAFDRMPELAAALESAGCTSDEILTHCRQPTDHVRGCWVLDLLLDQG
ncbi:hypothetical protein [Blastopirellula marina]|uniref:hypothetical protein n=1 Tax=Blastopirellula marina TaxID=124 RepID=UPI001304E7CB|nr:hypothetical protein [Blastopirellula marina]